jgi:hypothetical protein
LIGTVSPSRRLTSRVDASGEVWVYWQCGVRVDLSRVRNVSAGGMFLELNKPLAKGQTAKLHFLVPEGAIQANAEVRYAFPGQGLGLKFIAVEKECGPKLAEMLRRLRAMQRAANK